MNPTRREFMRQVGVFLATTIVSGCQVLRTTEPTPISTPMRTCYVPTAVPVTPTPQPTPGMTCYKPTEPVAPTPLISDAHWSALRASWLDLKNPKLQALEDTDFSRHLRQQHTDALKALVAGQQLDTAVAADIQVAFDQALAHIQRQQATCYIGLPPEFTPRQDVITQTAALTEMAQRSAIDPVTVERARAALARDMAWLAQFQTGHTPINLDGIQATPTEIKAARTLVELLAEAD